MAIRRAWYVSCDNCGDPGDISAFSAKDARATAGGFVRRKIGGQLVDLCSRCRDIEKLPEERP